MTKALELNGEKILDRKMRLGKAKVKDPTVDDKKGTSLILSELSLLLLYLSFLELIDFHVVTAFFLTAKDARTLFVKNIPFAATKEDLRKVFDTAVEIRFPGGIGTPSKG